MDQVGLTGFGVEYANQATPPISLSQGTTPTSWAVRPYGRMPSLSRFVG